jgi:hypothetical protein
MADTSISNKAAEEKRAELSRRGDFGRLIISHVEAENAHNIDATLATLHPDCVYEDVPTGRVFRGHVGAQQYYREWWNAFGVLVAPDEKGRLYWADDGTHVAESRFLGRHIGAFQGIAPTLLPVEIRFVVFVTFKDGLLLGERFYYDQAGIFVQIGAVRLREPLILPTPSLNEATA